MNKKGMAVAVGDIIEVNDKMQTGYSYILVAPAGECKDADFMPFFSPKQMLEMGTLKVGSGCQAYCP